MAAELEELENKTTTEPESKREHPSFGLSKVGAAIVAILVIGLVAWHVGFTPNIDDIGRDAGGFAGGTSYGGGGGGGGSSYTGGSSHTYSSGGSHSYSSSSSGDLDWIDVVIALIIFLVIIGSGFVPSKKKGKSSSNRRQQPAGASKTPDSKLQPISALQARDPQFSAAAVEETIANVYVRMQQAWTAGNFEPMRPYFSNTLFSQFSNQLAGLTKQGKVNHVDNIAVLECAVRGWYETNGFEYLVLKVRTRITDYTVDKSGNVVGGFTDAESYMEYEYTLERPAGTLTTEQTAQTEAGECPNCGAPINLAQSAKCEYCGSVIESKRFTWVISIIKGISQRIEH